MIAMTIPPTAAETAAIAKFESTYARDSLGFVRWLMSADATDEMAAAAALLEKETNVRP
jgi:hypothetical protein